MGAKPLRVLQDQEQRTHDFTHEFTTFSGSVTTLLTTLHPAWFSPVSVDTPLDSLMGLLNRSISLVYHTFVLSRLCQNGEELTARRKRRRWKAHLRLCGDPDVRVQLTGHAEHRGRGNRGVRARTASWCSLIWARCFHSSPVVREMWIAVDSFRRLQNSGLGLVCVPACSAVPAPSLEP